MGFSLRVDGKSVKTTVWNAGLNKIQITDLVVYENDDGFDDLSSAPQADGANVGDNKATDDDELPF